MVLLIKLLPITYSQEPHNIKVAERMKGLVS